MRCVAVIPARYSSSRLPGKPLADILGKPMIQHVWERVKQVEGLAEVIVATDDQRIADAVHHFGGIPLLTSPNHPSGTDRLVEAKSRVEADIYLNVQGDEPLVDPEHLTRLLAAIQADSNIEVATLCHPISSEEAENPNSVKVVRNQANQALYFSRAKIPYYREGGTPPQYLKHIGVYAYRASALARFPELATSALEASEMLEQLRLMDSGIGIHLVEVASAASGVDTPACLERVIAHLSGAPAPASPSLGDIKLVLTDIDGVLTDGSIWYDESGECIKRFHVRDGLGIKMLQEAGIHVAVISGRDSATLRKRLSDLGIEDFALGVKDKAKVCNDLMAKHHLQKHQAAFIGDDSIDLPAFEACGWPVSVADAEDYVKKHAKLVLSKPGGHGAFREFADKVLVAAGQSNIFDSASGFNAAMTNIAQ